MDGIETKGIDKVSVTKPFDLKMTSSETEIHDTLKADISMMFKQADELKGRFAAYRGSLYSALTEEKTD